MGAPLPQRNHFTLDLMEIGLSTPDVHRDLGDLCLRDGLDYSTKA
jgi:hypothetical protein